MTCAAPKTRVSSGASNAARLRINRVMRPLSHAFRGEQSPSPGSTERSRKGPFAFLGRMSRVRSGPAWAATQKHRPGTLSLRAARPVDVGTGQDETLHGDEGVRRLNRRPLGALGGSFEVVNAQAVALSGFFSSSARDHTPEISTGHHLKGSFAGRGVEGIGPFTLGQTMEKRA